jgi:protein-disulfide isomerase
MKRALTFAGALATTAFGSYDFQPTPVAAAPQKDWSQTVVATPEGGFRMGNPAAKVKLVEYGSLTCPHCAHFSAEAKGPLAAYVKSGKVSFEFRNYVLNGIDVTATLLARCAPPSKFFALTDRLYATQSSWVGKISGLSQAEKDRLKTLPSGQRLGRLADVGGLTQLAAAGGVSPARGKQCLADEAALDRLGKMGEAAAALGVQGTPTFFLNGQMLGVNEWAQIEPLIRQAGG